MDIRALVLVKTAAETVVDPVQLSPLSPALLDIVGKSPLQRTVARLHRFGIQAVKVVSDSDYLVPNPATNGDAAGYVSAGRERFWRAAENAFNELVQDSAELVLLVSMDGYAEIDFEKLVQFHIDQHARVTQTCVESRPLQVFCISASRRNDAASLLRSQLTKCRSECPVFEHRGYFNALSNARDMRQLAIDILTLKTETRPAGTEVRPGVWIDRGAVIEKGARILAPAFVGASARIRTHVVVTRCSSVEHHARIDCGTVLENSTVLPYCCVGAGLDVAHSVVGVQALANLRRDVIVEILDRHLISSALAASSERLLHAALEFVSYLPKQVWQGLFGKSQPQQPDLQTGLRQTSPSLGKAAGYQAPAHDTRAAEEFPSNLAVVRRYGHQ
jgi:carbonic anhydrase/acetyltransferase-like protein (isoleucine patch superfamily)